MAKKKPSLKQSRKGKPERVKQTPEQMLEVVKVLNEALGGKVSGEELKREQEECARSAEAKRYITYKRLLEGEDSEDRRKLIAAIDPKIGAIFEWERKFRIEKNPLAAWDAYIHCRRQNMPIPKWVLEYLDGVESRLMAKVPKGKNEAKDLAWKALGLSTIGPGTAHSRYLTIYRQHRAVRKVIALMEKKEMGIDDACVEVAEQISKISGEDVEFITIRKWYYALIKKL